MSNKCQNIYSIRKNRPVLQMGTVRPEPIYMIRVKPPTPPMLRGALTELPRRI